jgi:deazaflavin-dependent oxidoreductase (nitroreductase family)
VGRLTARAPRQLDGAQADHVQTATPPRFLRVAFLERQLNRLMGALAARGLGPRYTYRLEVQGRSSGRTYTTPVNLLRRAGRPYLVAPRGWTQWVRNAMASGRVRLTRGRSTQEFAVRLVPEGERPPILKEYLERYRPAVQRYFEVKAGSPVEAFRAIASGFPVFELTESRDSRDAPGSRSR